MSGPVVTRPVAVEKTYFNVSIPSHVSPKGVTLYLLLITQPQSCFYSLPIKYYTYCVCCIDCMFLNKIKFNSYKNGWSNFHCERYLVIYLFYIVYRHILDSSIYFVGVQRAGLAATIATYDHCS